MFLDRVWIIVAFDLSEGALFEKHRDGENMATSEHRKYERIAIELPCRLYVEDKNGDLRFEAFSTTGNLCLGGVFVVSDFLLKEGVAITTELALPSGPLGK